MRPERVFVDANVLVSASAFTGNERKLLRLAAEGKITLVVADVVYHEAHRVLCEKFPEKVQVFEHAMVVIDHERVEEPSLCLQTEARRIVRDPGDVVVLASILASKPDFALTGDKDLLTKEVQAIAPTCRCADYLKERKD